MINALVPDPHTQRLAKVSPLFAKLHDMPPALFTVGTYDPLIDDSLLNQAERTWLARYRERREEHLKRDGE